MPTIGHADRVVASLERCKPGSPPVYRDGELCALDPHDNVSTCGSFASACAHCA